MTQTQVVQGQAQVLAASEAVEEVRLTRVRLHEDLCNAKARNVAKVGLSAFQKPLERWQEHARPVGGAAGSLAAALTTAGELSFDPNVTAPR